MTPHITPDERAMAASIDALDYDFTYFDIDDFASHVAHIRQRPLHVERLPLQRDLFGFCWSQGAQDFIVVNATLHPAHQTHSLLHELAHLLLAHRGRELPPHIVGHTSGGVTGHLRSVYRDPATRGEEREAEMFVALVQLRIFAARRERELYEGPTSIAPYRETMRGMDF